MANPQTLQTVLNRVLTSLREGTIPTGTTQLTDPYQLTLLEFFNQVREEVEDACNWRALQQTYTVTFPAGTYAVKITGTNERSRLVRVAVQGQGNLSDSGFYGPPVIGSDNLIPLVFDTTAPTGAGNYPLKEMPLSALLYMVTTTQAQQVQQPSAFALSTSNVDDADAGEGEQWLYVYPVPNNQRTVEITMVTPETTYLATDVARDISIPTLPIVHGLQWMAREERGEELGANSMYTEERYRMILDAAVSRENAEGGDSQDLLLV